MFDSALMVDCLRPDFVTSFHRSDVAQVADILADLRQAAEQAEDIANKATASSTNTAVDKAKARAAMTRAAHVPEELLRALGTRGRGLDYGCGRGYGLSLLKVVEDVAAEASASGERSQGG